MIEATTYDICANKHKGNEFSKKANKMTKKLRDRLLIVAHLKTVDDATCEETEMALGLVRSTCSARFSEMKNDGELVPTVRRTTRTGCSAQAWKLV